MTGQGMQSVEHKGRAYALVLRANATSSDKYNFLTGPESPLQLGMNFYEAGESVKAHYHLPRQIQTTQINEFILIGEGSTTLTLFDADDQTPFTELLLEKGDMVLLLAGGHGFKMHAPTKIVEIKQGPYDGKSKDKVVFG
jgi:oxalate decarboxylase/phosphoglucose isomerase-like protein (cupin superfamily)